MQIKISAKKKLTACICLTASLSAAAVQAVTLEAIDGVPSKSIEDVLNSLTTWILGFGLALCVIMIIWGGLNYVASAGDEQRIGQSKKTIHYAVFGIAIIGFSFAIIKVVNDVLTQ